MMQRYLQKMRLKLGILDLDILMTVDGKLSSMKYAEKTHENVHGHIRLITKHLKKVVKHPASFLEHVGTNEIDKQKKLLKITLTNTSLVSIVWNFINNNFGGKK